VVPSDAVFVILIEALISGIAFLLTSSRFFVFRSDPSDALSLLSLECSRLQYSLRLFYAMVVDVCLDISFSISSAFSAITDHCFACT
jgi:hypothetical protein